MQNSKSSVLAAPATMATLKDTEESFHAFVNLVRSIHPKRPLPKTNGRNDKRLEPSKPSPGFLQRQKNLARFAAGNRNALTTEEKEILRKKYARIQKRTRYHQVEIKAKEAAQ